MIFCKEFLLSKIFNFRLKLYFLIKQLYFFTASPQPVPDEVILFSTSGRVERGGKMERGLGREGKGNNPLLFIYTAVEVRRDWNVICFQPLARGGSGLGGGDVWHFRLASANFWSAVLQWASYWLTDVSMPISTRAPVIVQWYREKRGSCKNFGPISKSRKRFRWVLKSQFSGNFCFSEFRSFSLPTGSRGVSDLSFFRVSSRIFLSSWVQVIDLS